MQTSRRDFIRGTAWMGVAAAFAGCATPTAGGGERRSVRGGLAPIQTVRTGFIGLGRRGSEAARRMSAIPGAVVTALCDIDESRVLRQQAWLRQNGKPEACAFVSEKDNVEAWRRLCASEDVDLVYIAAPWQEQAKMACEAMSCGKHVAVEAPAAMTVEDCWKLVETSERTGRHCVQLDSCCYGEAEMLCLNLVQNGLLGEIVHVEGSYVLDLRESLYRSPKHGGDSGYWRLKWNARHQGGCCPVGGLMPVLRVLGVNRGDRLDSVCCVQSVAHGNDLYAADTFGARSWQAGVHPMCGDMSLVMGRTVGGRTVLARHAVSTPQPSARHNLVQGTRGMFRGTEFASQAEDFIRIGDGVQFAWEEKVGVGVATYFDFEKTEELRTKWRHPLWRQEWPRLSAMGDQEGRDFLMDMSLVHSLRNGLPPDRDVYDLATVCSLVELSERSCQEGGQPQKVPDFMCNS